jgi:hypothetical protein
LIGPEIDAVYLWVDGDRLPALDLWRARLVGQLDPGDSGPCFPDPSPFEIAPSSVVVDEGRTVER